MVSSLFGPAIGSGVPGTQHKASIASSVPPDAAWTDQELADPHAHAEKAGKVRGMFGAIAHRYDLNNRVHSLWRDQAWRRYAVRAAGVREGDMVVDVACGTGDLTHALARTRAAAVVGIDFSRPMLDVAEAKRARLPAKECGRVTYLEGDAMELPIADASADVVSIAFGIRNVVDPARALREFARVLRPGGRLVVLEFDRPGPALIRRLSDWYRGWLMPRTATFLSGDRTGAYKYLPKSVDTFLSRDAMCGLIRACGLTEVTSKALTFGVCRCYRAVKP
jgi:demethylmenaquinone methyltransferase/2-methoxy-6-polyprenyl-1,4-benzoquinol methylase